MRSDRRVNQSYDNHPRQQQPPPRTLGNLRRGVSNAAWEASWRIQQGWGWIGAVTFCLALVAAVGFAAFVLFDLIW